MDKKNLYLGLALFCFALCFAFRFDQAGVKWFWEGYPLVPMLSAVASLLCLGLYFGTKRSQVR